MKISRRFESSFENFPVSRPILSGLRRAEYTRVTSIQKTVLPFALCGRDVIGSAKTGSGKTLAFVIPVLEKIYRGYFMSVDGIGGLVITSIREIAIQICEEIKKMQSKTLIRSLVVIGGGDSSREIKELPYTNIVISTPGKLLECMISKSKLDLTQLEILVIDEADQLLSFFLDSLETICSKFLTLHQTLLFSATELNCHQFLINSRLFRLNPKHISINADSIHPTPLFLSQIYVVCRQKEKTNLLWSFIDGHHNVKTIIFFATCKQARFLFEVFRKLRPDSPVLCLNGKMKQMKRIKVYLKFNECRYMTLFATDIASRGLDFKRVDWVVQVECPDDIVQYIHRVGRTARYFNSGHAMIMLRPEEKHDMLRQLRNNQISIKPAKINRKRKIDIVPSLQVLLTKHSTLHKMAQQAFISLIKNLFTSGKNAIIADQHSMLSETAYSLGISYVPFAAS